MDLTIVMNKVGRMILIYKVGMLMEIVILTHELWGPTIKEVYI